MKPTRAGEFAAIRLEASGAPMAAEYVPSPAMPSQKRRRLVEQFVAEATDFADAARTAAGFIDTLEDVDWRGRMSWIHHLLLQDHLGNRRCFVVQCVKIVAEYEAREITEKKPQPVTGDLLPPPPPASRRS